MVVHVFSNRRIEVQGDTVPCYLRPCFKKDNQKQKGRKETGEGGC